MTWVRFFDIPIPEEVKMAAFSQESLDRIEQAAYPHKERFLITPNEIAKTFTYGEHLHIFADEEGYLCLNQGERSITQFRFPDEDAAIAYFIKFVPLALYRHAHEDYPATTAEQDRES